MNRRPITIPTTTTTTNSSTPNATPTTTPTTTTTTTPNPTTTRRHCPHFLFEKYNTSKSRDRAERVLHLQKHPLSLPHKHPLPQQKLRSPQRTPQNPKSASRCHRTHRQLSPARHQQLRYPRTHTQTQKGHLGIHKKQPLLDC